MQSGDITCSSWSWTTGLPIYVGLTDGSLTQTAPSTTGQVVYTIGIALNSTSIRVNAPSGYYIQK